jgi:hypothetical protein
MRIGADTLVRDLVESKFQDPCDTVEPYIYELVCTWNLNLSLSARAATVSETFLVILDSLLVTGLTYRFVEG